jgi:hypothetical protein
VLTDWTLPDAILNSIYVNDSHIHKNEQLPWKLCRPLLSSDHVLKGSIFLPTLLTTYVKTKSIPRKKKKNQW